MSDFHYHRMQRSMDRAQRQYDNQMPPEDPPMRECDQCGDEYEPEYEDDGESVTCVHDICEKCRKLNEEGPQQ